MTHATPHWIITRPDSTRGNGGVCWEIYPNESGPIIRYFNDTTEEQFCVARRSTYQELVRDAALRMISSFVLTPDMALPEGF